jgi:cellulose synthase/poly-beta-1,6-N-acetylglucosamine synthase-like glycosyltransferase
MDLLFLEGLAKMHSLSYLAYSLFLIPVTFFSFIYYLASFRAILGKEYNTNHTIDAGLFPYVSVQIPTYNEPVAIRCAESCLSFDYPPDKFEIIIGDDSDDEEVSREIDSFAKKHKGKVLVTRRGKNLGFKPGNLNHMLDHSKGEIVVIFDSDFTAPTDFLKRIVAPFINDENVACVQAEWDFINVGTNHISKLATTLLMFYYSLIVPLNRKFDVPLILGSGEAIRKDILLKLGGWTPGMLTEDTEYSLRVLKAGYKIVYLNDLKVYGEVPYTLKGLISQQKRWSYGNTTAFLKHAKSIITGPMSLMQKIMISYTTYFGYITNFFLLAFFISGTLYFFSQPPAPIDIMRFLGEISPIVLMTSGFIFGGIVALHKKNKKEILLHSLLATFTLGILVSVNVCVGFANAVRGQQMMWTAVKKEGNNQYMGVGQK